MYLGGRLISDSVSRELGWSATIPCRARGLPPGTYIVNVGVHAGEIWSGSKLLEAWTTDAIVSLDQTLLIGERPLGSDDRALMPPPDDHAGGGGALERRKDAPPGQSNGPARGSGYEWSGRLPTIHIRDLC